MRVRFTTAAYYRSHWKQPSRGVAAWGFQRSRWYAAFDRDLYGRVEWVQKTLSEAKKELASRVGDSDDLFAVMP